jgi:ubiquinone/menaquinone biosynthesis C-methylase UbiE
MEGTQASTNELARHLRLHQEVSAQLGQLPDALRMALIQAKYVLDIGCGAGMWLTDMAKQHPYSDYFGVDCDASLVALAYQHAGQQRVRNVVFLVDDMNHLDPIVFHEGVFGYINLAFVAQAMLNTDYAALAKTLYRLCCPGGAIVWTECDLPITTSKAFARISKLLYRALDAVGHRYGPPSPLQEIMEEQRKKQGLPEPERGHLAITPMLHYWLACAGCVEVREEVRSVDVSSYARAHSVFVEQMPFFLHKIRPFLTVGQTIDERAFDRLADAAMREINAEDFCGRIYALTAWGRRPPVSAPNTP